MTDRPSGEAELPDPAGGGGVPASYLDPAPRRGGGRLAALGLGLAALSGAAVFAVVALSATSGSTTPEAAVERLAAAIGDEDVIGVLEALDPPERSVLRSGIEDLGDELRRLGIASDDFDLGAVRGVDLEVDGLAMATEDLADGLAAVRLTGGTITASTQPDQLPIGPTLQRFLDHPDFGLQLEPARATEELPADAPVIVAVDEGDGWHVSLSYSIAENARRSAGEPVPALGRGVEPSGAESPEAAVSEAVRAAVGLDARRVISLADPDEARALYDYASLFLDDAEAEAAELRAGSFRLDVDRLDLDPEVDGEVAQVQVIGFAVSGTPGDGSRFSLSFDGDCFSMDFGDGSGNICTSDMQPPGSPVVERPLVLTAVRHEGRWYLSPTRTAFQQVLGSLRALERSDLEDPERFFGFGFGIPPFFGMPGGFEAVPSGAGDNDATCAIDTRTLRTALEAYYAQFGNYTVSPADGARDDISGTRADEGLLVGNGFLSVESDLHDAIVYDDDPAAGVVDPRISSYVQDGAPPEPDCGQVDGKVGSPNAESPVTGSNPNT